MKINCLSCGHNLDLGDTYEDYDGQVKCWCGALLEIRTEDGTLKSVKVVKAAIQATSRNKRAPDAAAT